MKITRRQLRRIINEALTQSQRATAAYAAEHRREHGQKGAWKTSAGDDEVDWKVGDLVRKVDYYGTGYGEDYKKSVGDQIGTVIEIDEDIDGTQYTVIFPDGTTVMDTWDSFEAPK